MEGVARRSEQGGAVIENNAERNTLHEFAEASFGEETLEEQRFLQDG